MRRTFSLVSLSPRLSARDVTLAQLLEDHRALTTEQITAMLFRSPRTCLNRLRLLRRLEFLNRFRPLARGGQRGPWHWIPGTLSSRYVALARDIRPLTPRMLAQRQDAIMASPQLRHLLGANTFFTDLIADSRTRSQARLCRWWSETATAAAFSRRIHPDGHGVWQIGERSVGFFLEHDTGTEDHARLVGKLDAYRRLHADGGPDYAVLFWLPTRVREANLHRHLTEAVRSRLTVATASRDELDGRSPAGPLWRVAGGGPHRVSLIELPGGHGEIGPYAPGPPSAEQDPLYLLTETVE